MLSYLSGRITFPVVSIIPYLSRFETMLVPLKQYVMVVYASGAGILCPLSPSPPHALNTAITGSMHSINLMSVLNRSKLWNIKNFSCKLKVECC